jgi:hypothetical protein
MNYQPFAANHPLSPENQYAEDSETIFEFQRVCTRAINSMRASAETLENLNTIDGKKKAQAARDLIEDLQLQLFDEGLCSDEQGNASVLPLPDYVDFLIDAGRHPRFLCGESEL